MKNQNGRLMHKSADFPIFGAKPAKGFTPLIGLAVVVALALAAVFGSMSLANPAQAQSAGVQLTAAPGDNQVLLNWTVTGVTLAAGNIWQYRSALSEDAFTNQDWTDITGDQTTRNATVPNLGNGEEYKFQVRALTASGGTQIANSRSNTAMATPQNGPSGTLTVTSAIPADTAGTLQVSWTWVPDSDSETVTGWQYQLNGGSWMNVPGGAAANSVTITGLTTDTHTVNVRPVANGIVGALVAATGDLAPTTGAPAATTLMASGSTPGSAVRYTLSFEAGSPISGLDGQIKLEMEDFGVPGSIDTKSIVIRVRHDANNNDDLTDAGDFDQPSNPQDIETDDEEIILHVGDVDPTDGSDAIDGISTGDLVTITIQADANVTLPTEGGDYSWSVAGSSSSEITVRRKVSLDEDDGGRGDMLTATGKGFKNGTSIHFWLDTNMKRSA